MNHKPIVGPFPDEGENIFGGQEPNQEIAADLAYKRYVVECTVNRTPISVSESQFKETYNQQHPQKIDSHKIPKVNLESDNPNIKRELVGNRLIVKALSNIGLEKKDTPRPQVSPPKVKQVVNQTGIHVSQGYQPVSTNVPLCPECGTLHPRSLTGRCPMVHGDEEKDELTELLFKPMRTIIEPFLKGKSEDEISRMLSHILIEVSKSIRID